jgi:periplasmic protein TonB
VTLVWVRTPPLVTLDPLEVTLERYEPPRVLPSAVPEPPPPPERVTAAPKPKLTPQKKMMQLQPEKPAAVSPTPPPVLALPQTTKTDVPPALPIPQSDEKPAVVAEKPAAPDASVSRPASPSEGQVAATTPPISDAAYLQNPRPAYPMSARRRGEQGTVLLKVLVTREGTAATVSVETSSGSKSLDEAALEAVRKWRFVPAKRGAQPVEEWYEIPLVFKLEGGS